VRAGETSDRNRCSVEGSLQDRGARPGYRRMRHKLLCWICRFLAGLRLDEPPVFKGYWLEMVAVVPSNLVISIVNGSLYVLALSLRKLSATASPSSKEVSVSLRQWMPAWMP